MVKLCNVRKYIFAALLLGIGIGIILSRIFGMGCFFGIVFVGVGIWRMV